MDHLEQLIGPEEKHTMPCTASGVSGIAGEEGFADTDGSEEEDVFVAIEEAKAEEITRAITVEGDGCVPIEVLEGVEFIEAGAVEAVGEILVITACDLVGESEFEEVERSESGLLGVGRAIG
jgi:hypothetical protein